MRRPHVAGRILDERAAAADPRAGDALGRVAPVGCEPVDDENAVAQESMREMEGDRPRQAHERVRARLAAEARQARDCGAAAADARGQLQEALGRLGGLRGAFEWINIVQLL